MILILTFCVDRLAGLFIRGSGGYLYIKEEFEEDKMNLDREKQSKEHEILPRGSKIIRVSCNQESYPNLIRGKAEFKLFLDAIIKDQPELFPDAIADGYFLCVKGRCSKKLDKLQFRRIKLKATGEIYSVYPSFVMPYLIAYTSEVEKGLMLRKHDVPYSTLVYIFGHDEMYWYRAEQAFGGL